MRRAFLVYGQYVLIWDSVDPGDKQGRLTCPLTLNTRDGAARLLLQDRTLRMIRPRKDLFLAVASDGGRVSLALEDGILHDAYHIRPHMPVEGGVGSAKRLVLTSEAGRLECVMLLYPLDHEEKPPEFQAEFGNGGIRVTVKGNGAEDRFLLGDPDIQFSRAGGAAYAF